MKRQINIILCASLIISSLFSCADEIVDSVAKTPNEGELMITPDEADIILNKVNAENTTATTLDWNELSYGVNTPVNYSIQFDASSGDFSNTPVKPIEIGSNEKSFTHAELNAIALKLNLPVNVVGQMKVRIKASLNFGALPVYSNIGILSVRPFDALKFSLPSQLYLQGDALVSNWGYPIPDSQKMVKIDNHRFGLIVSLTGGKKFAFITSPTAWSDPSYKANTTTEPLAGGNFIASGSTTDPVWGGHDINSPTITGIYQVIIDFRDGTYTVTPAQTITAAPTDLYIIGDATVSGWSAPNATQKFTKESDGYTFRITTTLKSGVFAFITAQATWSNPAYRAKTVSEPLLGGNFIASGSGTVPVDGGYNISIPASGTYEITVNFKSGTYILTLQ